MKDRVAPNPYQGTTSVVPTATAAIKGFSSCLLPSEIREAITKRVIFRGQPLLACSALGIGLVVLALAGCRLDMQDQPKYKPLAASTFFIDGRSARPIPPGTVARDALKDTDVLHTGADGKGFAATIPLPVDQALLERGQERFDIYCSPCHGYLGDGDGMVARRGFKIPPSLHHERVRQAAPGYIFQVITNGYGAMGDYGDQIPPDDRWAIVAYIRALELARGATMADATAEGQAQLEAQP
jgi:mono/diheme cytochrome c family protein